MSDARGRSELALPRLWLPLRRINSSLLSLSCSNEALVNFNCFDALNFHRSSFEFNLSVPDFPSGVTTFV